MTFNCGCKERKERLQNMSTDFKKGFLVALGVMAALFVVSWAMKLI